MNDDIPRGPEDIPLKGYYKEFYIYVVIIDVISGRKIREEKINYGNLEARKWLGRITFWACNNKYEIRTCAEADYKIEL